MDEKEKKVDDKGKKVNEKEKNVDEKYLAHIAEDGREQSNSEHLENTASLAADFARPFRGEEWARLCGLGHDIGKYSAEFQKRIRGAKMKVDHATKGSQILLGQGAVPAAFCVAGHHGGLPDRGSPLDTGDMTTLYGRWKKKVPEAKAWEAEVRLPKTPELKHKDPLSQAFFTRMLFSCLVDADYLDTETFMAGQKLRKETHPGIPELHQRLMDYIEKEGFLRPNNAVNGHRAEVLRACLTGESRTPGLFSLTVPTGGGKTIASLAFALSHAKAHDLRRIIYVIPYCSIIDQTAAVFKEILGESAVLEHHSNALYEDDEDYLTAKSHKALATENWDYNIIVTSSVQFFESLYASKPSSCRKIHNISESVVIFDEAQTLPISCLRPCVAAMGELAENYKVSAVLCTATQPALDGLFAELSPALKRREICPNGAELFEGLRRTTIVRETENVQMEALTQRLQAHEQVLCIVNSRKAAQEVFGGLQGTGNIHLSTLMYPAHRIALIQEIRDRLEEGKPCRVVATSLIEAGVDVDFPAVYREEAGLDSILQAAGRCNREGEHPYSESIVTVFRLEGGGTPSIFSANIGAFRETMAKHGDLNDPAAVQDYFHTLLDLKGDALDKYQVLDSFTKGYQGSAFPFRTVGDRFKMIDTTAKTVYVPVERDGEEEEGNLEEIEALRQGLVNRTLLRKLGRYGVSVYPGHFEALVQAGDIEAIDEYNGILQNLALYGLYRAEGYVSANLARKTTGFSDRDLDLLWEAIFNMFEHDHAAARGKMAVRELIIFKHDSELGNAPAHKLFETVTVKRREGVTLPRAYADYEVQISPNIPEGVTCTRRS